MPFTPLFFGNAMTFVPSGTPVAFPSYSSGLDFELELAWVLRAPLYDASASEALDAIGGFVLLNDFRSARAWNQHLAQTRRHPPARPGTVWATSSTASSHPEP